MSVLSTILWSKFLNNRISGKIFLQAGPQSRSIGKKVNAVFDIIVTGLSFIFLSYSYFFTIFVGKILFVSFTSIGVIIETTAISFANWRFHYRKSWNANESRFSITFLWRLCADDILPGFSPLFANWSHIKMFCWYVRLNLFLYFLSIFASIFSLQK